MPRRVSLPGAEELFRRTGHASETADPTVDPPTRNTTNGQVPPHAPVPGPRRSSGRVKHDEKMTVYVTADELLDLEHARLELRRHHGLAVDRGRLVREAVSLVLADLEEHGHDSMLVQRLIED